MNKNSMQTAPGSRDIMWGDLLLLREYARRAIAQGDDTLVSLQDLKAHLMVEYFTYGKSLRLTERDLVLLLYKGVLY